nr:MAG TPA: hypothetical protein [Microviridae sp.]
MVNSFLSFARKFCQVILGTLNLTPLCVLCPFSLLCFTR